MIALAAWILGVMMGAAAAVVWSYKVVIPATIHSVAMRVQDRVKPMTDDEVRAYLRGLGERRRG